MREGWPFDRDDGNEPAPAGDAGDDAADDAGDGSTAGQDDGGPRGRSGSRPVLRALGITAVVTTSALGVLGMGALVVSGLGGLDVVLTGARDAAGVPATADPASTEGREDEYLASLVDEEEPPPPPPPGAVDPADVPEPVVRVVPLAPGESFAEDDDPWAVAYEVPDLPGAWEALPEGLVPFPPLGQSRSTLTVPGQSCNGPDGTGAVAGQWWSWAQERSNSLDQVSVGVVVTGWPAGTGADAFADVAQDDGTCSWLGDLPAAADVDVPSADEDWAGTRSDVGGEGSSVLYGAARTGDLVVGVEVRTPPSEVEVAQVEALLEAVVVELQEVDPGGAAG